MNDDTTTRFIASLVKSLQSLCHGYVEFEKNIEIIGHIYLNIDSQQKYDYVVNEQVCKNEDESQAMFVSNSFHAQPARTTVRTSRQCNALDLKIQSAKDTIGIDLSTFQTDVGQGRSASRESSQSLSAGSETGSVSGNVPNREPGTSPSLHCQNPERSVSRRKRHLHDLSSKPSPDVSPPSRSRDGERRDHHDSPSLRSQYTLGASASKLARRISNELEKQGLATPAQTDNDVEIHTRLSGSNETPSRFGRNGQGASQRQFSDDSSKHIDSIKDPPEKSEGQLLADSIDLSRVKEEVIEDESLFDQLDWNRAARDADQETYDPQAEGHEASEDQIVAENLAAAASSSLYPVMIHQNTAGLPMPGYGSPVFPQNFNEPTHTMSASSSPIASTSGQLSPGAVFGARRTQPGNSGRGYTAQFTPRPGKVPQDMASKFNIPNEDIRAVSSYTQIKDEDVMMSTSQVMASSSSNVNNFQDPSQEMTLSSSTYNDSQDPSQEMTSLALIKEDSEYPMTPNQDMTWPSSANKDSEYPMTTNQDMTWPSSTNKDSEYPMTPNQDMTWPSTTNKDSEYPMTPNQDMTWPSTTNKDSEYPMTPNQDMTWPPSTNDKLELPRSPSQDMAYPTSINEEPEVPSRHRRRASMAASQALNYQMSFMDDDDVLVVKETPDEDFKVEDDDDEEEEGEEEEEEDSSSPKQVDQGDQSVENSAESPGNMKSETSNMDAPKQFLSSHKTILKCIVCCYTCNNRKALKCHIWDEHGSEVFFCQSCNKMFLDKAEMQVHRDAKHPNRFVCYVCGKFYTLKSHLNAHIKFVHNNHSRHCTFPGCDKILKNPKSLKVHLKMHE
ncbi:uncharacterized protein [Haliotis cracherodii]|uniref:uncharacterized protein isoform X1 n=1 Tax=Haliotis cracherodii TaxID=6455 RepID=UPI0039E760D6